MACSTSSDSSRAATRDLGALKQCAPTAALAASPDESLEHELFLLTVAEGGVAPLSIQAEISSVGAQALSFIPAACRGRRQQTPVSQTSAGLPSQWLANLSAPPSAGPPILEALFPPRRALPAPLSPQMTSH